VATPTASLNAPPSAERRSIGPDRLEALLVALVAGLDLLFAKAVVAVFG